MSLQGFPLTAVSNTGDRYLGMDARPEFLTNLVVDDTYTKAAQSTLAKTGTGSVISIPIDNKDLKDTMTGLNTRQVAPLDFVESRAQLVTPDLTQAAINQHVFGMGVIETFKSDKPQSGTNFLRKQIQVPADLSAGWNVPVVGPYNPITGLVNKPVLDVDPRYQAPALRPAM